MTLDVFIVSVKVMALMQAMSRSKLRGEELRTIAVLSILEHAVGVSDSSGDWTLVEVFKTSKIDDMVRVRLIVLSSDVLGDLKSLFVWREISDLELLSESVDEA